MKPVLNLLRLSKLTIFEQLQLEEALLRADQSNWCLVQDGVPPAIVMGISGRSDEHLNLNLLQQAPVSVIKRFSGGGTVFVDHHTAFVTFIFQSEAIHVPPNPDKVFCWSQHFYKEVFQQYPFSLKERDYVFENRKFGGNAQYMKKDRWLHHTTFLWDYNPENMAYLLLPSRRPAYRQDRSHTEFLCRLSDYMKSREEFWSRLHTTLGNRFEIREQSYHDIASILQAPHRRATEKIKA